jgi:RNA polymerase sigma-70 factor (ECF subfamily)
MTGADEFEAFVRRFEDMVFATALRLVGNPADAEDVSQVAFLRAFQRFADLRDNPAAAGWLRTVTRNLALNHLTRYRARWRVFSEFEAPGAPGADDADDAASYQDMLVSPSSPIAELEQAEAQGQLERALHSLPDHQRVPLVLFHLEDMSYQEIAETLRISMAKVKTDIHRGREALRKQLAPRHASR